METSGQQKKVKNWWCIYFGHENKEDGAVKRLNAIFKQITPEVVYGNQRVFLNVSQSKWRRSFSLFQSKITQIAEKHDLNPDSWQWGAGETLAEAWVSSRYKTLSLEFLPIEAISDYLNPFEHQKKSAEESRRFRILRSLNINSLQDLMEVPEDVLLSQCGVWIAEFTREHFSHPETIREGWLETITAESFTKSDGRFRLEDWIPEEYLEVG
jgi:hypothetical protein